MRAIMRQTCLLILFVTLLYSPVCGLCLLFSSEKRAFVDTYYYEEAFRILAFDACRLQRSDKPKLIILGSSNSLLGFRPDQLQPLFPSYEVANLSIPGSNMTDVRQVLEMLEMILPSRVQERSLFVLGIYYESIYGDGNKAIPSSDKSKSINDALVKSGIYRWKGNTISPIVPAKRLELLVQALRPLQLLNGLRKPRYLNPFQFRDPFARSNVSSEGAFADSADDNIFRNAPDGECIHTGSTQLKKYIDSGCSFANEKKQFGELITICDFIHSHGGTLLLVDLPLPWWQQRQSRFHALYQKQKQLYFEQILSYPRCFLINLLEMNELCDDSLFMDRAHPCPFARKLWSKTLKEQWEQMRACQSHSSIQQIGGIACSGHPTDSGP